MKKKIFIVDDDPTVMNFLSPFLSKKKYASEYADNGEDAYRKITQSPPDLIISDIVMPRMDGFQLYRRLRETANTEGIPFIFLSAKNDPMDQLKGFRMGAQEYLTKPVDLQHLLDTVKKVLAAAAKTKSSTEKIDFGGNLAEVNLEDIVQIIEMNQKTGELVFAGPQDETAGAVYFKDGRIVHAVTDNLEGEEAFYELSSIKNSYARFFIKSIHVPETISNQTMALLFEAARMKDEAQNLSSMIDDVNVSLAVTSRDLPAGIKDNLGPEWTSSVISLAEKGKTAGEIIDSGQMSRIRAKNILAELIGSGIVQTISPPAIFKKSFTHVDKNLAAKLRKIEAEALTGVLSISSRSADAVIYFANGCIDQAHHNHTSGKKALFRIFSEKDPTFSFKKEAIIIENEIQSDLVSLFIESEKESDSKNALTDQKLDSKVFITPGAFEKIAQIDKGPELSIILRIAAEEKTLRAILEKSPLTDLKTINHLVYLRNFGLIEVKKGIKNNDHDAVTEEKPHAAPKVRLSAEAPAGLKA